MNKIVLCLVLIFGSGLAESIDAAEKTCPDVTGHYRVAGFGPVLGDALEVWGAQSAGFSDSEVKISGNSNRALSLFWKSGRTGVMSSRPNRVWRLNEHYHCQDGWIIFKHMVAADRQTDAGWLEGKAELRITRDAVGGLSIASVFSGRQRTTLYSYDSARVSIPKLGTGKTLSDVIRFPKISEPLPPSLVAVDVPEPRVVLDVREMLSHRLLQGIVLGGANERGDAVLVTLKATSGEEVAQFEDRLHAALIAYEMKTLPIWSNSSYHFTMLVQSKRAQNRQGIKYSSHWVLQEMKKISHPMVDATDVVEQDDAYLVTLQVLDNVSADQIITLLKRRSSMVADVQMISDKINPQRPKLRAVILKVRLH